MALDIRYVVKNVTFFNNPYYEYEFYPINVTIGNTTVEMETTQFMEYFIYASKKIINIIDTEGHLNNETDFIYKVLRDNWPSMKHINHFNLKWYEKVGKEELDFAYKSVIVLLVLIIILLTSYFLIIYLYDRYLEQKREKVFFLFRLIPLNGV